MSITMIQKFSICSYLFHCEIFASILLQFEQTAELYFQYVLLSSYKNYQIIHYQTYHLLQVQIKQQPKNSRKMEQQSFNKAIQQADQQDRSQRNIDSNQSGNVTFEGVSQQALAIIVNSNNESTQLDFISQTIIDQVISEVSSSIQSLSLSQEVIVKNDDKNSQQKAQQKMLTFLNSSQSEREDSLIQTSEYMCLNKTVASLQKDQIVDIDLKSNKDFMKTFNQVTEYILIQVEKKKEPQNLNQGLNNPSKQANFSYQLSDSADKIKNQLKPSHQLVIEESLQKQIQEKMDILRLQKLIGGFTKPEYADILFKTGMLYKDKKNKDKYDYQMSLNCFNLSLQIFFSRYNQYKQQYAESLFRIAEIQIKRGKYKEGINLIQQAQVQALNAFGKKKSILYANALHYNGLAVSYSKNNEDAIKLLKKSIQIKKQLNEDPEKINFILTDLAYSYSQIKQYSKALNTLDQQKKTRSGFKKGIIDHRVEGLSQSLYGKIYQSFKDYKKAREYYERQYYHIKKEFGVQNIYVSIPLKNLGQIYLLQKEYNKAQNCLTKGLKLVQRICGIKNPKYAKINFVLGKLYLESNKVQKALQVLLECEQVFRDSLDKKDVHLGKALFYLGKTCKQIQNIEQAKQYLQQSKSIMKANYGQKDEQYLEISNQLQTLL